MKKQAIFIYFLLLLPYSLLSQTISGKIENKSGEKIIISNIIIKDSLQSDIIREFVIARNGQYMITLKNTYQKIVIAVSANQYITDFAEIDNPSKAEHYKHDFILQKDEAKNLDEVVISAKAPDFMVKEDTMKYNVSAYRDGSERKIEDIIKKLPDVSVNETTGEIKYKGTPVETVKLEGDDLFGRNYAIGTKNINVDMVEQVQAIDNYSDNPLLKGIESSDKVILNLKLKAEKMDFSGDIEAGIGISAAENLMHNSAANLLAISKGYKSFATISYNNVGVNNSPYDYFSYNFNAEQVSEEAVRAKKIISENLYAGFIDSKRANINRALFGSYNSTFKIGTHMRVKTNLYLINDRIHSTQLFRNDILINDQRLLTSDNYDAIKKPLMYRGDLEIKSNISKNSLLEYKLKISQEKINTAINALQNEINSYESRLESRDDYLNQSLLFTQKISAKEALQISLTHTINNIPQNYYLLPSFYDTGAYLSDRQLSNFKKEALNLKAILLKSKAKNKFTLILGSDFEKNRFNSDLYVTTNEATNRIDDFSNNFLNEKRNTYFTSTYAYNARKWRISAAATLSYLQQQLNDEAQGKNRDAVIFEPNISIAYKINSTATVKAGASYNQKPFSEEYLFTNPVYTSNRFINSNIPVLEFQKTYQISLAYIIRDLYHQFFFNIGISHSINEGNYFANILLNENSTQTRYFYLPEGNTFTNLDFSIQKYVSFLESNVRLTSNYTISNYKNIVNNSDLRNNYNQFIFSELFIKTGFDIKINFENSLNHRINIAESQGNSKITNTSFNNTFKIIIKPAERWFFITSADYYLPDFSNKKEDFLFVDATLQFSPKNKRYNFYMTGKNLTNVKYFTQTNVADFSRSYFQANLLSGYILLKLSYNL
jgi:hypothetical protein